MLSENSSGTFLFIQVQAKASRTGLAGVHGETLKIRVAAPPVEGAANTELCEYLAKIFGIPKSRVVIAAGQRSKRKKVQLMGVNAQTAHDIIQRRLGSEKPECGTK